MLNLDIERNHMNIKTKAAALTVVYLIAIFLAVAVGMNVNTQILVMAGYTAAGVGSIYLLYKLILAELEFKQEKARYAESEAKLIVK